MASKNKNLIARLQHWMDSAAGQTFMNYAYSWGAAVVILGTLFKLTHIPGANAMLFIGMGTEVFVFFVSGFDRPAGVKDQEDILEKADEACSSMPSGASEDGVQPQDPMGSIVAGTQPVVAGGPIIIGGGVPGGTPHYDASQQPVQMDGMQQPVASGTTAGQQTSVGGFDVRLLAEAVNASNAEMLEAARNACNPEMKEAAEAYVEELKTLTETLSRVSAQAESMTRDSKEMDNLNRTLTGINTIYEMQLKSISTQVGTIDQINEQTRKMARQIEELNAIYNRMIQAMTVNMQRSAGSPSAL